MNKNIRLSNTDLKAIKQTISDITGKDIKDIKSRRDPYVSDIKINGIVFCEIQLANMNSEQLLTTLNAAFKA